MHQYSGDQLAVLYAQLQSNPLPPQYLPPQQQQRLQQHQNHPAPQHHPAPQYLQQQQPVNQQQQYPQQQNQHQIPQQQNPFLKHPQQQRPPQQRLEQRQQQQQLQPQQQAQQHLTAFLAAAHGLGTAENGDGSLRGGAFSAACWVQSSGGHAGADDDPHLLQYSHGSNAVQGFDSAQGFAGAGQRLGLTAPSPCPRRPGGALLPAGSSGVGPPHGPLHGLLNLRNPAPPAADSGGANAVVGSAPPSTLYCFLPFGGAGACAAAAPAFAMGVAPPPAGGNGPHGGFSGGLGGAGAGCNPGGAGPPADHGYSGYLSQPSRMQTSGSLYAPQPPQQHQQQQQQQQQHQQQYNYQLYQQQSWPQQPLQSQPSGAPAYMHSQPAVASQPAQGAWWAYAGQAAEMLLRAASTTDAVTSGSCAAAASSGSGGQLYTDVAASGPQNAMEVGGGTQPDGCASPWTAMRASVAAAIAAATNVSQGGQGNAPHGTAAAAAAASAAAAAPSVRHDSYMFDIGSPTGPCRGMASPLVLSPLPRSQRDDAAGLSGWFASPPPALKRNRAVATSSTVSAGAGAAAAADVTTSPEDTACGGSIPVSAGDGAMAVGTGAAAEDRTAACSSPARSPFAAAAAATAAAAVAGDGAWADAGEMTPRGRAAGPGFEAAGTPMSAAVHFLLGSLGSPSPSAMLRVVGMCTDPWHGGAPAGSTDQAAGLLPPNWDASPTTAATHAAVTGSMEAAAAAGATGAEVAAAPAPPPFRKVEDAAEHVPALARVVTTGMAERLEVWQQQSPPPPQQQWQQPQLQLTGSMRATVGPRSRDPRAWRDESGAAACASSLRDDGAAAGPGLHPPTAPVPQHAGRTAVAATTASAAAAAGPAEDAAQVDAAAAMAAATRGAAAATVAAAAAFAATLDSPALILMHPGHGGGSTLSCLESQGFLLSPRYEFGEFIGGGSSTDGWQGAGDDGAAGWPQALAPPLAVCGLDLSAALRHACEQGGSGAADGGGGGVARVGDGGGGAVGAGGAECGAEPQAVRTVGRTSQPGPLAVQPSGGELASSAAVGAPAAQRVETVPVSAAPAPLQPAWGAAAAEQAAPPVARGAAPKKPAAEVRAAAAAAAAPRRAVDKGRGDSGAGGPGRGSQTQHAEGVEVEATAPGPRFKQPPKQQHKRQRQSLPPPLGLSPLQQQLSDAPNRGPTGGAAAGTAQPQLASASNQAAPSAAPNMSAAKDAEAPPPAAAARRGSRARAAPAAHAPPEPVVSPPVRAARQVKAPATLVVPVPVLPLQAGAGAVRPALPEARRPDAAAVRLQAASGVELGKQRRQPSGTGLGQQPVKGAAPTGVVAPSTAAAEAAKAGVGDGPLASQAGGTRGKVPDAPAAAAPARTTQQPQAKAPSARALAAPGSRQSNVVPAREQLPPPQPPQQQNPQKGELGGRIVGPGTTRPAVAVRPAAAAPSSLAGAGPSRAAAPAKANLAPTRHAAAPALAPEAPPLLVAPAGVAADANAAGTRPGTRSPQVAARGSTVAAPVGERALAGRVKVEVARAKAASAQAQAQAQASDNGRAVAQALAPSSAQQRGGGPPQTVSHATALASATAAAQGQPTAAETAPRSAGAAPPAPATSHPPVVAGAPGAAAGAAAGGGRDARMVAAAGQALQVVQPRAAAVRAAAAISLQQSKASSSPLSSGGSGGAKTAAKRPADGPAAATAGVSVKRHRAGADELHAPSGPSRRRTDGATAAASDALGSAGAAVEGRAAPTPTAAARGSRRGGTRPDPDLASPDTAAAAAALRMLGVRRRRSSEVGVEEGNEGGGPAAKRLRTASGAKVPSAPKPGPKPKIKRKPTAAPAAALLSGAAAAAAGAGAGLGGAAAAVGASAASAATGEEAAKGPAAKKKPGIRLPSQIPNVVAAAASILLTMEPATKMFEKTFRAEFGNNPDTSKALRLLWERGHVERSGRGFRCDPFGYTVTPAGLEAAAEQRSREEQEAEARVQAQGAAGSTAAVAQA